MQNKTYKPTQAIQNNSLRGLAFLQKSTSLSAKTALDKVQAISKSATSDECTLDEVKKLYTFLVKAERDYKPMNRVQGGDLDIPSALFLAGGGTSALAWSRLNLTKAGILKSYTKEITEAEINKEEELQGIKLPINKAVNDDLKQVLYVAMFADEADLHGDITTADEVRKACHNFNTHCMKANLFHMVETDSFSIVESYIAPTDFILGEHLVKANTWLVNLQIHDTDVWELVKSGEINGVSIGALASVQPLGDTDE